MSGQGGEERMQQSIPDTVETAQLTSELLGYHMVLSLQIEQLCFSDLTSASER